MRRGVLALVILAALSAPPPARAQGAKTYTWTLVESPGVHLRWPNELSAPDTFETDGGMLGRIISQTSETITNSCQLAESHPCAAGEPPAILGLGSVEGPANEGGPTECNRRTIGCGNVASETIPGAHGGHPGSPTPGETVMGEFSHLAVHRVGGAKTMAFVSGSYSTQKQAYECDGCPPEGPGRDIDNTQALAAARLAAATQTTGVSLWTTQLADAGTTAAGHGLLSLDASGAGRTSACDNGAQFESLLMTRCAGGAYPIPVKWTVRTYSTTQANHASRTNPGRCDSPDCYIRNVIVPAAVAQSSQAKNVQVRQASAVIPQSVAADAAGMTNATLDVILFAFTTQLIDQDGDGIEDRLDPCPNDPADTCRMDLIGGGACPAGQVFCSDAIGTLGCLDPFLCSQRLDTNQDCAVDLVDLVSIAGQGDGQLTGTEAFNSGVSIGPFEP